MMRITAFLVSISLIFVSCANRRYVSMQDIYKSKRITLQRALYPDMSWAPKGTPLRIPEEIIAVWVPSYVKKDGTLVSSHYVFIVVRPSRWYFEEGALGVFNELKKIPDKKDTSETEAP